MLLPQLSSLRFLALIPLLLLAAPPAKGGIGDFVKEAAKGTEKAIEKGEKKISKASKKIARKVGQLGSDGAKAVGGAYEQGTEAFKAGYQGAMKGLKKSQLEVVKPLFQKAGQAALHGKSKFLKALLHNIRNLDEEGISARDRLAVALRKGKLDKDAKLDMVVLARKLGLRSRNTSSILPENHLESSWGIYLAGGAGAIVGAEVSPSFVMNTSKENGRLAMGVALGGSGSIGMEGGGAVQVGVFWSPGTVADTTGTSVGLGFDAAAGPIGVGVGLSWSVTKDMFHEAANGIPGFNVGWAGGLKVNAGSISIGYTHLLVD